MYFLHWADIFLLDKLQVYLNQQHKNGPWYTQNIALHYEDRLLNSKYQQDKGSPDKMQCLLGNNSLAHKVTH
jgi:hypothetical protein